MSDRRCSGGHRARSLRERIQVKSVTTHCRHSPKMPHPIRQFAHLRISSEDQARTAPAVLLDPVIRLPRSALSALLGLDHPAALLGQHLPLVP